MTYDEAIAMLVADDVAKWGESEREASETMHRGNLKTIGRVMNTLANRGLVNAEDAKAAMTRSDVAKLSRDGRD